jgi:hypothetical protein
VARIATFFLVSAARAPSLDYIYVFC